MLSSTTSGARGVTLISVPLVVSTSGTGSTISSRSVMTRAWQAFTMPGSSHSPPISMPFSTRTLQVPHTPERQS
jgi:hypothetical protein